MAIPAFKPTTTGFFRLNRDWGVKVTRGYFILFKMRYDADFWYVRSLVHNKINEGVIISRVQLSH